VRPVLRFLAGNPIDPGGFVGVDLDGDGGFSFYGEPRTAPGRQPG
jgi:hypothetical protein